MFRKRKVSLYEEDFGYSAVSDSVRSYTTNKSFPISVFTYDIFIESIQRLAEKLGYDRSDMTSSELFQFATNYPLALRKIINERSKKHIFLKDYIPNEPTMIMVKHEDLKISFYFIFDQQDLKFVFLDPNLIPPSYAYLLADLI
jgi:hypothetical protein